MPPLSYDQARSSKVEDIITCLPSHMIRLEVVKLKISSHASLSHDQARSSKVEDIITCLPSHMIRLEVVKLKISSHSSPLT